MDQKLKVNEYETIFILRPDLTEEGTKKIHDRIAEIIGRSQGQVVGVKDLGKKQLAYPIAKQTRGHYFQVNFQGTGKAVEDLERHLRLSEEAIRFLTVHAEKGPGEKPHTEKSERYERAQEVYS